MALIGNYSVILKSPTRFRGGTTVSGDRANFNNSSSARNMYVGSDINKKNAVPNGYLPPGSWIIPFTAGGMASYTDLTSLCAITSGNLAAGMNISSDTASLTGVISVSSAVCDLIGTLTSSVTGLGTLAPSTLFGVLSASVAITGLGLITNSALGLLAFNTASITGVIAVTNGNLSNAALLAIASLTGSVSITNGDLRALANLTSDILPYTELSPQALADAVWGKSLVDELDSGTYGKLIKQIKAMISAGL